MSSITLSLTISVCLATLALSAPTDTPAGQDIQVTTPVDTAALNREASASTPVTDVSANATTTSMTPVSLSFHDSPPINTTSFTCYGRSIGYYADVEHDCKVYHFCLLGDYNDDVIYQRISYLCLKDTLFDQQALDCVEAPKMSAPCSESAKYFDSSNTILRKAIVGSASNDSGATTTH